MRESPNGMASASQADSRGFDSRLSLQKRPQKNSGVFFWSEAHRTTGARKAWLYGSGMPRACRFGLEEPCALAAQTPVDRSFHRRTQSMALRQRHVLRLSVRARRALRPRGANSRRSFFPQAHAKHGSTAAACPAPVGSGSKSLAPSRRKLPSFAPSHRRTQSMALRQRHAPRLSVRVRRALRPCGANSRLLLLPTGARKAWLYGSGMPRVCRFGFEEPCALAAQTPVFCLFGCNPTIKLLFKPQPENFPIFM